VLWPETPNDLNTEIHCFWSCATPFSMGSYFVSLSLFYEGVVIRRLHPILITRSAKSRKHWQCNLFFLERYLLTSFELQVVISLLALGLFRICCSVIICNGARPHIRLRKKYSNLVIFLIWNEISTFLAGAGLSNIASLQGQMLLGRLTRSVGWDSILFHLDGLVVRLERHLWLGPM
jgi:hypothetical protein